MLEKIVIREKHRPKSGTSMMRRVGAVSVIEDGEEKPMFELESAARLWSREARARLAESHGERAGEVPLAFEDAWLNAIDPPTT